MVEPETNEDLLITVDDVRYAGHCVPGLKSWFSQHGLDLRDFIQNGVRESVLREKGDALSDRVIERKREREGL